MAYFTWIGSTPLLSLFTIDKSYSNGITDGAVSYAFWTTVHYNGTRNDIVTPLFVLRSNDFNFLWLLYCWRRHLAMTSMITYRPQSSTEGHNIFPNALQLNESIHFQYKHRSIYRWRVNEDFKQATTGYLL